MANEKILLCNINPITGKFLEQTLIKSGLFHIEVFSQLEDLETHVKQNQADLVILSDSICCQQDLDFGQRVFNLAPHLPVILFLENYSKEQALTACQQGFFDCLPVSITEYDLIDRLERSLIWRRKLKDFIRLEARRGTKSLQHRLDDLQALQKIGSQITASLELDRVLTCVVDAAVDLTGAEEGSLLLLDETTGELYMRASRNFQEDFVKTFRLPIQDTLAGQVLQTGKPILLEENNPHIITASYHVHAIMYVPLLVHNQVIGILGVDNRLSKRSFSNNHLTLVSSLADYAAIAIQNAKLFSHTQLEHNKLESILTNIEDGVIVIDPDNRLTLINRKAQEIFQIQEQHFYGKNIQDIIQHQELLEVLREKSQTAPSRAEINLEDGRVFYAQLTPIQEIGLVITLQDITNLKELDRIKSDFVNTVSHDLRSPLTAILGYVELIERVGAVNDQQKEFIHRVQISVHNITSLINDLLDLGRIEAGFDSRKEVVPISTIIHYTVDGLRGRIDEKSLTLIVDEPDELPQVLGNPVRLRQMLSNLISNAIKYTSQGGKIFVITRAEEEQIIIQIKDTGRGIPAIDQPYIFDKFYRASNIPSDSPGTGLGLAIVKSIVENHQGRIWVDSVPGAGASFTIVLPLVTKNL